MSVQFSVIVPTYNRADLLPFTLDAIARQTLSAAEIIVVDDGSTDGTRGVVARYGDAIRYLRVANGGAPAARNAGVRLSSSRWLAFCDSDDLWRCDHLAKLSRAIEATPQAAFAFANFVHVIDDRWQERTKFDQAPPGYWQRLGIGRTGGLAVIHRPIYPDLLAFQPVFPSCIAVSRAYFDKMGGFDPRFAREVSEDMEFTLRCNREERPVGVVLDATVGIRKHGGNISGDALSRACSEIRILRFARDSHRPTRSWSRLIDDQIALRSSAAIHGAFTAGRLDLVRELSANIPYRRRSWKIWLKLGLASLPRPAARSLSSAAAGLGRLKSLRAPQPSAKA